MTNEGFRDTGPAVPASDESRTTLRKAVGLRARLRDVGAKSFEIKVIDLSLTGFRAETVFNLHPGELVWISLPGLAGIEAEVAWKSHEHIGCAFRRPLYPAVFDHIVALGQQ